MAAPCPWCFTSTHECPCAEAPWGMRSLGVLPLWVLPRWVSYEVHMLPGNIILKTCRGVCWAGAASPGTQPNWRQGGKHIGHLDACAAQ